MSRHLVTGIGGQDGILLARHLLALGEQVVGTVTYLPDERVRAYLPDVELAELDVRSTATFAALVREHRPDVVHNLAALSSVGASWEQPELTDEVNHRAVLGMLSVIGEAGIDFLQPSSSEIFGPVESGVVDEGTPLNPVSPYAEAKAHAHRAVIEARNDGARATNLILFGHTGPLHDPKFVLPSITRQAAATALGQADGVTLRDPTVARDWGSAADFVRAFALAALPSSADQSAVPADPESSRLADQNSQRVDDYVIATGQVHRLADVAEWALDAAHADPSPLSADPVSSRQVDQNSRRVDQNSRRVGVRASGDPARPNDFGGVRGDSSRAANHLDWRPEVTLRTAVEQMVRADLARLHTGIEHSPDYLA